MSVSLNRSIQKSKVAGSNPASSLKIKNIFSGFFFVFFLLSVFLVLIVKLSLSVLISLLGKKSSIQDFCLPLYIKPYIIVFIDATGNAMFG